MHSAHSMQAQTAKRNPAKQYNAKEDAENAAYRMKDGTLFVPARAIKGCMVNASSWTKFGKLSAKPIIAGSTHIEPSEVSLGTKDYEIDLRPVVVQRARIIRARPRLDSWKLKFQIIYNDDVIQQTEILKNILEEAGQRIGLLDNRPQKYGDNGTFKVTSFKEVN